MGSLTLEQYNWVIGPLLDSGLDRDGAHDLLVELCFETTIHGNHGTVAAIAGIAARHPHPVQAAWGKVVGRLISLHPDL